MALGMFLKSYHPPNSLFCPSLSCVCTCVSLYLLFSLYLCRFLYFSFSDSFSVSCVHACVHVFFLSCHCLSPSHYVSASVSLSVFLSLVVPLPLFVFVSVFFSVSLSLYISASVSFCFCLCLPQFHILSLPSHHHPVHVG